MSSPPKTLDKVSKSDPAVSGGKASGLAPSKSVPNIPSKNADGVTKPKLTLVDETKNAKRPSLGIESVGSGDTDEGALDYPDIDAKVYHQADKEWLEKKNIRDRSETKKLLILSIMPEPKEGISGWTTMGFSASQIPNCPAGMEAIVQQQRIFIEVAGYEFEKVFRAEVDNKFELFTEDKQRIYFAAETLDERDSFPGKVREVDFTVCGSEGGLVFSMTGTTQNAIIGNETTKFGSIKKLGWASCFKSSPNFGIFDDKGTHLSTIVPRIGTGYKQVDYLVYPMDNNLEAKEVASIRQNWIDQLQGPQEFGVVFPQDLNPTYKTLLLGSMLLMFFRQQEPINYGPNKRRFLFGLCFNLGILLMIFALIGVVGFMFYWSAKYGVTDNDKDATEELAKLCRGAEGYKKPDDAL